MLLAHMWLLAGAIMRPALRPPSFSSAARCVSPLSCATTAVEDAVDDDAPPLLRVLRAGGLDAAQAQEVYERRPPGKLPGAVRQELLLEWVQRELLCSREPARLTYVLLRREPKLLLAGGRIPRLRETHAALRGALWRLKPERLGFVLAHNPELLLLDPERVRSTASWLGGRLGYSDQLLGEVLAAAPRLLAGDPEAMEERLAWLDEQLGIGEVGRLQRVVRLAPLVLLLSLEKTLRPRVAFVRALGVDDTLLANLIVRSPRLLHSPEAALAARVDWLTDNKIVEKAGGGIAAFLARQPDFFALSPAQCAKRLDTLEALGLSRAAALRAVRDEPGILSQPEEQLKLRAAFFFEVLSGSVAQLEQVPHMFTCELAKHALLRHAFCLSTGRQLEPTALMVKGNAQFCTEVAGCSEDELREFEKEGKHLQFYAGAWL